MLELDKKGTHLKYFSQKQDVILVKNQLVSASNRWDRLAARVAERTRQLDNAHAEASLFHDAYDELMAWIAQGGWHAFSCDFYWFLLWYPVGVRLSGALTIQRLLTRTPKTRQTRTQTLPLPPLLYNSCPCVSRYGTSLAVLSC